MAEGNLRVSLGPPLRTKSGRIEIGFAEVHRAKTLATTTTTATTTTDYRSFVV